MNLEKARAKLGDLVRRAVNGELVVIHVRGVPTARLVPYRELAIEAIEGERPDGPDPGVALG